MLRVIVFSIVTSALCYVVIANSNKPEEAKKTEER